MPYANVPARWLILVVSASCVVLATRFYGGGSLPRVSAWAPASYTSAAPGQPETTAPNIAKPLVASFGPTGASVPLRLGGELAFNVNAALNASNGALRDVTIVPGATWSFNATVGDPSQVVVHSIGGVPGGGWCDLAARYVQAVRPLLPSQAVRFVNHVTTSGIALADVANEDAVSIWNIDGQPGSSGSRQDLEITNTLAHPLHFQVIQQPDGSQLVVQATVVVDQ